MGRGGARIGAGRKRKTNSLRALLGTSGVRQPPASRAHVSADAQQSLAHPSARSVPALPPVLEAPGSPASAGSTAGAADGRD